MALLSYLLRALSQFPNAGWYLRCSRSFGNGLSQITTQVGSLVGGKKYFSNPKRKPAQSRSTLRHAIVKVFKSRDGISAGTRATYPDGKSTNKRNAPTLYQYVNCEPIRQRLKCALRAIDRAQIRLEKTRNPVSCRDRNRKSNRNYGQNALV